MCLAKLVGRHKSKDLGLQAFQALVVERLDGSFLDGSVHAFGLSIGPWVIWLGQLVQDAVFLADTVEDVATEHGLLDLDKLWDSG